MGSRVWWGSALSLVLTSCAGRAFQGPEQGGAEWTEGRSQHFRLLSMQDEADAQRTLEHLERTQAVLEQVAFPSAENPPGVTEVVLLPVAEYDELVEAGAIPRLTVGYYSELGPRFARQPRFVVRGGLDRTATRILQHELTHRFVGFHCPNAPVWFNEGLAEFWETLTVEDGVATFGGAIRVPRRPPPFDDLLKFDYQSFYAEDELERVLNYAGAAALVQVLYFQHRDVLTRYVNLLKAGHASASDAWRDASHAHATAIAGDYAQFFGEHAREGRLPVQVRWGEPFVNPLPDVEVHLLWASLWAQKPGERPQLQRELDAAVRTDPNSAEALVMRALYGDESGPLDGPRRDINRALELAPSRSIVVASALAFALGTKQPLRESTETLAERLLRLRPTARNLALVGQYFGSTGQLERGIQLLDRAVRLDSSCVDCYALGSELLVAAGKLEQAIAARRAAIALSGERASEPQRARLRELEARLAAAQSR